MGRAALAAAATRATKRVTYVRHKVGTRDVERLVGALVVDAEVNGHAAVRATLLLSRWLCAVLRGGAHARHTDTRK